MSDLNCFSLEGEWLYRLCETDPRSGLGTVLLSLKTTQLEELDEKEDEALCVCVIERAGLVPKFNKIYVTLHFVLLFKL